MIRISTFLQLLHYYSSVKTHCDEKKGIKEQELKVIRIGGRWRYWLERIKQVLKDTELTKEQETNEVVITRCPMSYRFFIWKQIVEQW